MVFHVGVVEAVIVMFTVFAAVAAVMVRVTTALLSDSAPEVFTARTAKYQVPAPSAATDALVAVALLTDCERFRLLALVPYRIRYPLRLVSEEPSVFCVGATQLKFAVPL